MMGLVACQTHDADARVYILIDRGGLPVCLSAFPQDLYRAALDRDEDEIGFYTLRGPEVYRLVAGDSRRSPQDGGPISCVRLLHADLSDVPDLPDLGYLDGPDDAIGPERPAPPTPERRRRKPR